MLGLKDKEGAAIAAVLSDRKLNVMESTILANKLADFFSNL